MTMLAERHGSRRLDGSDAPPVLGDILRTQAALRPRASAIGFEGRTTSYALLAERAFRVANALSAAGLAPGDRIAHVGRNSDAWFDLLLGAGTAGMVLVPVNWRLTSGEIAHILADSTARAVFVDRAFASTVYDALDGVGLALPPVEIEDEFPAWRDAASPVDPAVEVDPHDVVLQIYTSGTTGRPKGALLTHHSINTVRVSQPPAEEWNRWTSDDVCVVSMPLFHIGGASMALSALYHGARMVVVREFLPEMLFDTIERERVTRLFLVPAAINIALAHPRARTSDYSSLAHIVYGSSPIDPALLAEAMAVFGCGFVQVYGLTETSGTVVALPPADHDPNRPERLASVGRAMRGVTLAILGADGAHLPAGEVGEVAILSQAIMAGYWRQPEATAEAFTADGWLRTGDIGFLDDDGYLHLRDRVKDMIISGGENVYAAEVEAVFARHPAIAEVAVVGVPHPVWGEAVKAMVVLRPGAALTLDETVRWGRERLAPYKLPASIELLDRLPRNAAGKVSRRELRAPYWPTEN